MRRAEALEQSKGAQRSFDLVTVTGLSRTAEQVSDRLGTPTEQTSRTLLVVLDAAGRPKTTWRS
ncbi:MAG TPA: hypothetical protein VES60_11550 [Nakamurella sp.]|nr:hypothetical protein [Nakamurella sp.]